MSTDPPAARPRHRTQSDGSQERKGEREPGPALDPGVEPEDVLAGVVPEAEKFPEAETLPRLDSGPRRRGPGSPRAESRRDLVKFARDAIIKFAGSVANGVLGFVGVVVITRGLRAGQSGAFFQAFALFTILTSTGALGADTGFMRMIPRYRSLGNTRDLRRTLLVGLWPTIPVATAFGAAMFIFAPGLAELFTRDSRHATALIPFIRAFAPFIPASVALVVVLAATRGFGAMVPSVAVNNVGAPALRPLLVLSALALGLGSTAIAAAWAIPFAVGLPVAIVWLLRLLQSAERSEVVESANPRPARHLASEFWRFSVPRAFAVIFQTTTIWLDTLLLGALRSAEEAGIYTAATRYAALGAAFIQAIVIVISPQIAALLTRPEDHDRANFLLRNTATWMVIATWPIYITLAVFTPFFLDVFGREFSAGQDPLLVLTLAILFSTGVGPIATVLLMGGKSSLNMLNTIVSLAVNVVLNVILIPRFGMTGAAFAWAASIVATNVLSLIQVQMYLRLNPFSSSHLLVAGSAALIFGGLGILVRLTFGTTLQAIAGFGVVASALYAAVLWRNRARLHLSALRASIRARRPRDGQRGRRGLEPSADDWIETPER
jgi:O-antigen/teichoic acid export membrane protein